ncbi:MAG TPA: type II secretion system protein [Acidimicrobiales bacterium]|jgi:type II secretory pathway pseudopilin PulG|nr:type II secretion system protein [Acidimicrobiales bacterium]
MSRAGTIVRRWTRRHRGDGGFTLIELASVVAITSVFGIAITSSLQSFTKTTTSTQNKTFALADVRGAVENIARDLRAANPIEAISSTLPVSQYDNRISFTVWCATPGDNGCTSANARRVVYQLTGNTLVQTVGARTRNLLEPDPGMPTLAAALRPGAVVNTASQPIFTYYTKKGTQLSTTGGTPATTFRNCTKTVKIHLVVMADPRRPDSAINLVTHVDLRNSNEVTNCP